MAFNDFKQRYGILASSSVPAGFVDGKVAVEKLVAAQRQHLHLHILHRLAKLLRFQPGLIPGFNPVSTRFDTRFQPGLKPGTRTGLNPVLLSGFRVPVTVFG